MSTIDKIKPIFASPLLLLKSLRKTKLDNFLGGLIIGAIFSLIVNVATVQIQEKIHKQRILEAVENEILNNLFAANNALSLNNEWIKNKAQTNYLYTPRKYSRDLWEQSTEPLQYIAQLPREIQNKIAIYYSLTVPLSNALVDRIDNMTRNKLDDCVLNPKILNSTEQNDCRFTYETLLTFEQTPAEWISNGSFELLKEFHPTRDRQNNIFLRLIMGNESTRPLSGK